MTVKVIVSLLVLGSFVLAGCGSKDSEASKSATGTPKEAPDTSANHMPPDVKAAVQKGGQ